MIKIPKLPEIFTGTLVNGMKYIFIPTKGNGLIHASLSGYAGAILENEPATYGVAHCLEHVVLEGTKSFPTEKSISDMFDKNGCRRNGLTGMGKKEYWITTGIEKKQEAIQYISECLFAPILDPVIIEREKRIIANELKRSLSNLDTTKGRNNYKASFDMERLGVHIIGTIDSVSNLSRSDLEKFHSKFYTPSNFIFAIVADMEHDEVLEFLNKDLGQLQGGDAPEKVWVPQKGNNKVIFNEFGMENSSIDISWPIDKEYLFENSQELAVSSAILGKGNSSRLNRKLREELGLVYNVFSSVSSVSTFSSWLEISTQTNIENTEIVIEECLSVVQEYQRLIPTFEEFEQCMNNWLFNMKLEFVNELKVMNAVRTSMMYDKKFISAENELTKLFSLTIDDVKDVIKPILETPPLIVVHIPK